MVIKESTKTPASATSGFMRLWQFLVKPHPSITEIGEFRSAQLASSLILVVWLFIVLGFIASVIRNGTAEAVGGFGFPVIALPIAYILAKAKFYRMGIFIFAVVFSFSSYIDIIRQEGIGDVAADVYVFVPLSLIIASTYLSSWAVFLLTGLNIGGLLSVQFFGITLPPNLGGLAGVTTAIGVVLIFLGNFRNRVELSRLDEVRRINRDLEDLTSTLENRVNERTFELETANQQTTRRVAQLQAITELSEAISELQDLNELFPAATRLISERFGFYHVGIFLIDSEREYAILQAANSEGGKRMLARGHRLKLGTGVVGFAAQSGRPRIALDVGTDAVYFDNPDLPDTRSEVALPMKSRNETIGVLDVQSITAGAFSPDDLQVLTALANQVSIALENTRLLTETRAALIQVQEVYNEFTHAEWSRTVAQAEQPGFRYQAGRIELLDTSLRSPEVSSAVERGEAIASNPSDENRQVIAVPVKLRGEVIGVLHIESGDRDRQWSEDDISLVEAVAERAAFAMENARLFQAARRRAAKERLISEATARIGGALNIENILHTTAEELERVLGGSEVVIQFRNERQDEQ